MADEPEIVLDGDAFNAVDEQLAVRESASLSPLQDAMSALRQRAALVNEVVTIGLTQCSVNPKSCFTRYGDKFRLTGDGASRVLRCFGGTATYESDATGCGETGDGGWQWTAIATVSVPGVGSFEAVGYWSTDKPGYAAQVRNGRLTNTMKADIRKCAMTQAFVNATQRLLGVGALSAGELEAVGIDPAAVGSVDFREGGSGGRGKSPESPKGDELKAQIRDSLSAIDVEDSADIDELMVLLSAFAKNGKTINGQPLDRLSEGRLEVTLKTVQRMVEQCQEKGKSGSADAKKWATAYNKREVGDAS